MRGTVARRLLFQNERDLCSYTPAPPRTATELLRRLGKENAPKDEQRRAVSAWLLDSTPDAVLRASLRLHGAGLDTCTAFAKGGCGRVGPELARRRKPAREAGFRKAAGQGLEP